MRLEADASQEEPDARPAAEPLLEALVRHPGEPEADVGRLGGDSPEHAVQGIHRRPIPPHGRREHRHERLSAGCVRAYLCQAALSLLLCPLEGLLLGLARGLGPALRLLLLCPLPLCLLLCLPQLPQSLLVLRQEARNRLPRLLRGPPRLLLCCRGRGPLGRLAPRCLCSVGTLHGCTEARDDPGLEGRLRSVQPSQEVEHLLDHLRSIRGNTIKLKGLVKEWLQGLHTLCLLIYGLLRCLQSVLGRTGEVLSHLRLDNLELSARLALPPHLLGGWRQVCKLLLQVIKL
mmetsp:Transcript_27281/g.64018  ORF Transcript_27281/g.64018 Transcript_27281/m.64018 type:complete len:289 (-) Transcript_27281:105-971(-)